MDQQKVHQLRAIEALRAGVPNRDVVRSLPPHQSDVQEQFEALLEATPVIPRKLNCRRDCCWKAILAPVSRIGWNV